MARKQHKQDDGVAEMSDDVFATRGLFTTRALCVDTKAIDKKRRSVPVVASTEVIDGHGEIVEQVWELDRYKANPAYLWNHNSIFQQDTEVLGHAENMRVETNPDTGERELHMDLIHATADINPRADRIFKSFQAGHQRAVSVGFRPKEVRQETRDDKTVFVLSKNVLFETSAVPVGSNPEALNTESMQKRLDFLKGLAGVGATEIASEADNPDTVGDKNSSEVTSERATTPLGQEGKSPPAAACGPPVTKAVVTEQEIKAMQDALAKAMGDLAGETEGRKAAESKLAVSESALADKTKLLEAAESKASTLETEIEHSSKAVETAETRADTLSTELDESRVKCVALEVEALVGTKITPDEVDGLVEMAADVPEYYAKHIERVKKRADLPTAKDNILGADNSPGDGDPPETGNTEKAAAKAAANAAAANTPAPVNSVDERLRQKTESGKRVLVGAVETRA